MARIPYYVLTTATEKMRVAPSNTARVVSEAYFSEHLQVLEQVKGWTRIVTEIDHYAGWVPTRHLVLCDPSHRSSIAVHVSRLRAHIYDRPDTEYGAILTLPFDSHLVVLGEETSRWLKIALPKGNLGFIQSGDVTKQNRLLQMEELGAFSQQFLGLPYTWGGRSSFGYDCSGFVQMLYKQIGIFLPRDAKDQIGWKRFINRIPQEAEVGDLLFWGKHPDQIYHVGMSLGNRQFIHATVAENAPWIRVSSLDHPTWNGHGACRYVIGRTVQHVS